MENRRYAATETLYATVTAVRVDDKRVAAGVTVRGVANEVMATLHVFSLVIESPSVKQALPQIVSRVAEAAVGGYKLIIFRSQLRHFHENRWLHEHTWICSQRHGIAFYFVRTPRGGMRKWRETAALMYDAAAREYSLDCKVTGGSDIDTQKLEGDSRE